MKQELWPKGSPQRLTYFYKNNKTGDPSIQKCAEVNAAGGACTLCYLQNISSVSLSCLLSLTANNLVFDIFCLQVFLSSLLLLLFIAVAAGVNKR